MSTIGENIQHCRLKANLTQDELAQKMNISRATVAQYENNKRTPKFETVSKFAYALGVGLDELYPDGKTASDEIKAHLKKAFARLAAEDTNEVQASDSGSQLDAIGADLEKLNDSGQAEAVKRVHELTLIPEYAIAQK